MPGTDHPIDVSRTHLMAMAEAALAAVDPGAAIRRAVVRDGDLLRIRDTEIDLSRFGRVVVIGFGKASVGMGEAVLALLGDVEVTGVLVTDVARRVEPFQVLEAAHPVPDDRSERAGLTVLEVARSTRRGDLLLVLISGGGSSLIAVPMAGISLADLQEANELLLRSGATINEFNAIRKHLSAVKGGRLAEAATDAGAIATLVISDIVGNALDAIASGPTVPDPTTFADTLSILERSGVRDLMPQSVIRHLESGADGAVPDTPSGGPVFERQTIDIIADGPAAARAAAEAGSDLGYRVEVATTRLVGEARIVASEIVGAASKLAPGHVLVYAGETTVTVTGDGVGGRNQELVLAAAIAMAGEDDLTVLSLGTDGIDGRTPVAGGFADGSSFARGTALGLDAGDHLRRNDSHRYLSALGDTVTTGPTGTNVCDLIFFVRGE